MVATRAQKRYAVDNSNPLCQTGILQRVLSYVGPGHWFFLSTVSSFWKDLYSSLAASVMQIHRFGMHTAVRDFTCVPQMTLFSSIFASPSRVRLVHERGLDTTTASFRHAAGRYADVPALEAAHELGMQYDCETSLGAAMCNELSVLQYLHAQGCPWNHEATGAAARRGNFEMLRWTRTHRTAWSWMNDMILSEAASSGNIEMTAWVKQVPGVAFDEGAINVAAHFGRTAMCAYLRAEQCPWSQSTCYFAAYHGQGSTYRWLRENGCPWEADMDCIAAAIGGCVEVMQFLQEQGVLTAAKLTHMLSITGTHHHIAAAQWLREQGAEWPTVLTHIGMAWSGDVLAWARAEGCTSPTE
jgi:hypothetical protein